MRWKRQKKVIEEQVRDMVSEQVVLPYVPNAYWLDNGDLLLSSDRIIKRRSYYGLIGTQELVDDQVAEALHPYYWDDPYTGLAQLPPDHIYEVVKLDKPEVDMHGYGLCTEYKYAILVKNSDGDEVSHRLINSLSKEMLHGMSLLSAQDTWSALAAANAEAKYLGSYPPKEI